jgi:hypothetical protein
MSSGAVALEAFIPVRDAVTEGGECIPLHRNESGAVSVTAQFPNRKNPDTAITIFFHPDGTIAKYTELRGTIQPGTKAENVRDALEKTTRTVVQLDYVTREALMLNYPANANASGVRGTIQEFEKSLLLRDLKSRVDLVRRLCRKE